MSASNPKPYKPYDEAKRKPFSLSPWECGGRPTTTIGGRKEDAVIFSACLCEAISGLGETFSVVRLRAEACKPHTLSLASFMTQVRIPESKV